MENSTINSVSIFMNIHSLCICHTVKYFSKCKTNPAEKTHTYLFDKSLWRTTSGNYINYIIHLETTVLPYTKTSMQDNRSTAKQCICKPSVLQWFLDCWKITTPKKISCYILQTHVVIIC